MKDFIVMYSSTAVKMAKRLVYTFKIELQPCKHYLHSLSLHLLHIKVNIYDLLYI